jgi:hypothetical protein
LIITQDWFKIVNGETQLNVKTKGQ